MENVISKNLTSMKYLPAALLWKLSGYGIGAGEGIIYCRAEYPLAIKRLEKTIAEATRYGMLGENIFNSGFNFTLKLKRGRVHSSVEKKLPCSAFRGCSIWNVWRILSKIPAYADLDKQPPIR